MRKKPKPDRIRCTDCGAWMKFGTIGREFNRDGVRVRLGGIPAAVCPKCGDVSFAPGVVDRMARAANALFELAGDRHRGVLTAERT